MDALGYASIAAAKTNAAVKIFQVCSIFSGGIADARGRVFQKGLSRSFPAQRVLSENRS
jgi:hypothetical protein